VPPETRASLATTDHGYGRIEQRMSFRLVSLVLAPASVGAFWTIIRVVHIVHENDQRASKRPCIFAVIVKSFGSSSADSMHELLGLVRMRSKVQAMYRFLQNISIWRL